MKNLMLIVMFSLVSFFVISGFTTNHPTKVSDSLLQENQSVDIANEHEYSETSARQAVNNLYSKDQVKVVQTMLIEKGYAIGQVDGVFGQRTRDSLMTFQANNKLEVTGELNQNTLNVLEIYNSPDTIFSE